MPAIPSDLRIDYGRHQLLESDAAADPFSQFARWFDDARLANVPEANAMTLATADATGAPSARIVLLKELDDRGFVFYTNYESRKGQELAANPRAAICFFWQPIERQVRIEGRVEKVTREESDAYFHSRPVPAQIGAIASKQSTVLGSRAELEVKEAELARQFADSPIPLPDFWGGYRVIPQSVEFWQGRPSRLHDRLRYTKTNQGWAIERLSP